MHLCRTLFPTILERNGVLFSILSSKFFPSRCLYDDIVKNDKVEEFKNFIYFYSHEEVDEKEKVDKTPRELLK